MAQRECPLGGAFIGRVYSFDIPSRFPDMGWRVSSLVLIENELLSDNSIIDKGAGKEVTIN